MEDIQKIEKEIDCQIYTKKFSGIKPKYLIIDNHQYCKLDYAMLIFRRPQEPPLYKDWLEVVLSQRKEKYIDVVWKENKWKQKPNIKKFSN